MALINSLSHIPKGLKETIAALPGSVLFGYVTLGTGSIWPAVIVHSAMAISNSWFSFRAHPEMQFEGSDADRIR
jgi:membrane protease YdiL (CAAX protease family)